MPEDGLLQWRIAPRSIIDERKTAAQNMSPDKNDNAVNQAVEANAADRPLTTEYAPSGIVDTIPSLIYVLKTGTSQQKHDAAKAIGYIGKLGSIPATSKMDVKNVIVDILTNEPPNMTVAFAMLEALERIDNDTFWTLIVSWFAQIAKSKTDNNVNQVLKAMSNPAE